MFASVDEALEGEGSGRWRCSRRRSAAGSRPGCGCGLAERGHQSLVTVRERVAEEHDVAEAAYVGQGGAMVLVPGEPAVLDEARGPRVADEEGGHDEVELVGQPGGEELGVDAAAALDHQPAGAAVVEVLDQPPHPHLRAAVDHGRDLAEPLAGLADGRSRTVDELVGLTGREEPRPRVEPRTGRDGHLDRRGRQAAGHALVAARGAAHEQPRVVLAHRLGADEDRVGRGPDGVHPLEVGRVGQQQALARGVVEVAVDGHPAAEQDVGPVSHAG